MKNCVRCALLCVFGLLQAPVHAESSDEWVWGGNWLVVGQRLSSSATANASDRSQINTRLDLELQREFPLHKTRFFGHVRMGSGAGVQSAAPVFTGALNTTAFSGADDHLHDPKAVVAQAWFEFDLSSFSPGLSLVAGKIDPTVFFDDNALAHDESQKFLNNIFVHNPLLDTGGNYGIDENGFSPGALVQYQLQREGQPAWVFSIGAFGAGHGAQLDNTPSNPFLITQARMFGEFLPGLEGSAAAYFWNNPRVDNALTGLRESQSGWGFSGDQQLSDELGVFGRLSYGLNGVRNFDRAITYGLEFKGHRWTRPQDHVALALGHLRPDPQAVLAGAPPSREHSLELMYVYAVNEQWSLALDHQRIEAPGGDSSLPSVRVFGVRSTVKF